jgi:hypothetical protein
MPLSSRSLIPLPAEIAGLSGRFNAITTEDTGCTEEAQTLTAEDAEKCR